MFQFIIVLSVTLFEILHLSQKRQFLFINDNAAVSCSAIFIAIVESTEFVSAGMSSALLVLLLLQTHLHFVHLNLGSVDVHCKHLDDTLLFLDLLPVLQDGPFK